MGTKFCPLFRLGRCSEFCRRNPAAQCRFPAAAATTIRSMTDSLRFTILYEEGDDGWIVAQVKEVPGAISQGRTRAEARENVIDALRLMLSPEPEDLGVDSESVELTLTS